MAKRKTEPVRLSLLAWIVFKQTLKVTAVVALAGGLLFGLMFSLLLTVAVEPPSWLPDFPGRRTVVAFGVFFLNGMCLGGICGFFSGLISGAVRAWRYAENPPSSPAPPPAVATQEPAAGSSTPPQLPADDSSPSKEQPTCDS
jgi:hypothetical protein